MARLTRSIKSVVLLFSLMIIRVVYDFFRFLLCARIFSGKSAEMSALSALLCFAENKEHKPLLLHLAAAWRRRRRRQRRRKRRKHSSWDERDDIALVSRVHLEM
jgi:hypothetical protein